MPVPLDVIWEVSLTTVVILSTAFSIFIFTLPRAYNQFNARRIHDSYFTIEDRKQSDRSGYAYYQSHKDEEGTLTCDVSVQVVVLGDIGRSPRMQYHALSIAKHGGLVDLIGYVDSDVHPEIQASRFVNIIPLVPFPKAFQTNSRILFLILAPLKVLWQIQALYHALAYRTDASKWMLVQNPPSIPTLIVAQFICFFRNTRLIVDWHNFGFSILALRLGPKHPLVRVSDWYEGFFSRSAAAHFAVTNAMCRVLKAKWGIKAVALHDRPAAYFRPLNDKDRKDFLVQLPQLKNVNLISLSKRSWRLIVSSTSWTPDEDFSVLLEALVKYSRAATESIIKLPKLYVIITGRGPQKDEYLSQIQKLERDGKLHDVNVTTAWLSISDYASLLASADLGISLHTSSSGVDLPMKVVDMFGAGLPVAGWSKFEAWPELVQEGINGRGFESADGLARVLQELFGADGRELATLRDGALQQCQRRWDDEWMPIAGKLLKLQP